MKFNGDALEVLRKYREMTQTGLAKKMGKGVNQSVISNWEKGDTTPNSRQITKLAKVLGFHPKLLAAKFEVGSVVSWH